MASIDRIRASDGSGNAAVATVQSTRTAGSSTIVVDTVAGIPATFMGSMGTPHTFVDPITAETITVISEDTCVDFAGSVDGSNLEIDTIAPGYTDLGSAVDDIIIIRPTTQWGDNVAAVLEAAHNDDGSILDNAIDSEALFTDNVDPVKRDDELTFDYVASGGVWSGDAYASTRAASMTALVAYINGQRGTVAAVTARLFTASRDTYIDILNTAGVFTVVYTEVTNNNTSPALAANSIRIGIIVTGASNIAAAGSVNQGEENKILPIASSIAYSVTDSLGNLICPRDPNRKTLGYRQTLINQPTVTTAVDLTGISVPVIVPTGRKIKISLCLTVATNTDNAQILVGINETSTVLNTYNTGKNPASSGIGMVLLYQTSPSAGLHTYKGTIAAVAGTAQAVGGAGQPTLMIIELV